MSEFFEITVTEGKAARQTHDVLNNAFIISVVAFWVRYTEATTAVLNKKPVMMGLYVSRRSKAPLINGKDWAKRGKWITKGELDWILHCGDILMDQHLFYPLV